MSRRNHPRKVASTISIFALFLLLLTPMEAVADSPSPSETTSARPSLTPSSSPSETGAPSDIPSSYPSIISDAPSSSPTDGPTVKPSFAPSSFPTNEPSEIPTLAPSISPSKVPSISPSISPTVSVIPSSFPTMSPTMSMEPTVWPSSGPTISGSPSASPSSTPSDSSQPSSQPTNSPTTTSRPSPFPTSLPTYGPSITAQPSSSPSGIPSLLPSPQPTNKPSASPTASPTKQPTPSPTTEPSLSPSSHPTFVPTKLHSSVPTTTPSLFPSKQPTKFPTKRPTQTPTASPSRKPSKSPAPTQLDCIGNELNNRRFNIPGAGKRKCAWVARTETNYRCGLEGVKHKCPITCGLCTAEPTTLAPTKSSQPSSKPSVAPSKEPSRSPSVAPSKAKVTVVSTLEVVLTPVEGRKMNQSEAIMFEESVQEWLGAKLRDNNPPIEVESVKVIGQSVESSQSERRKLQANTADASSLTIEMETSGTFTPTGNATQDDIDFDSLISSAFKNHGADLVSTLKADAGYFGDLTGADVAEKVDPNQIGSGGGDSNRGTDSSNINRIIIACSASAGAALVFAASLFAYKRKRSNNTMQELQEDADFDAEELYHIEPSPKESNSWDDIEPTQPVPNVRKFSQSDDEDDAIFDEDKSQRTFNTLDKIYLNDKDNASYQSYGYSLEDGIMTKGSKDESISPNSVDPSGPVQMDLYGLNNSRYNFTEDDDTVEISVINTPGSVASGLTFDSFRRQGSKKKAAKEKEDGEKTDNVEDIEDNNYSPIVGSPGGYIRECTAPPGKLGVVIDTTRNGPVVHQVKDGSPLENIVFPGDRIIEIDGIDTRGMTASNVTKIMARRVGEPRQMKLKSKTNHQGE